MRSSARRRSGHAVKRTAGNSARISRALARLAAEREGDGLSGRIRRCRSGVLSLSFVPSSTSCAFSVAPLDPARMAVVPVRSRLRLVSSWVTVNVWLESEVALYFEVVGEGRRDRVGGRAPSRSSSTEVGPLE